MSTPSDYCFSESHEWFNIEGDIITIGITQFAANELTDITYVEMQSAGTTLGEHESVGEVESVKTTSDVVTPFAGEIIEINDAASDDPAILNSDPFGAGWLAKIKISEGANCESLMDQETYDSKYPV